MGEFSLIGTSRENREVAKEINLSLKLFQLGIEKIRRRHPKVGIGKVLTDRLICDKAYRKIHHTYSYRR